MGSEMCIRDRLLIVCIIVCCCVVVVFVLSAQHQSAVHRVSVLILRCCAANDALTVVCVVMLSLCAVCVARCPPALLVQRAAVSAGMPEGHATCTDERINLYTSTLVGRCWIDGWMVNGSRLQGKWMEFRVCFSIGYQLQNKFQSRKHSSFLYHSHLGRRTGGTLRP